jgi:acyl dehydratase
MTGEAAGGKEILTHSARARNTSADSENKIHDDEVAARYGFRGGLVPGVVIYGYMTAPLVARFAYDWLERGSMRVRFHQPFYEGEQVLIRAEVDAGAHPIDIAVTASHDDATACASGLARVNDGSAFLGTPSLDDYPERALPPLDARPAASRETLVPGLVLGTLTEELDLRLMESGLLAGLDEKLAVYYGAEAVAHPTALLAMSNYVLMRNFDLGPWIHAASDVINWGAARHSERVSARARVRETFERKGHGFVVIDTLLVAGEGRVVQQVRHTAIYRPRVS